MMNANIKRGQTWPWLHFEHIVSHSFFALFDTCDVKERRS